MTRDDNHDADKAETSNPSQPIPLQTSQLPYTVSSIKLSILKKREYDIWPMKMKHYLCHTDYLIWQVIQNVNGPVSVTTDTNGMIKVLPPKTAKEVVARERERKARTSFLMALLEDHLAKFHKMADAKEIDSWCWCFTLGCKPEFLRSQPSSWSQVALIMRSKPGLDTLSFDDLYNNLRVFERDVKGNFPKDCKAKLNQDSRRRDGGYNGNKARDNSRRPASQDDSKALVTIDGETSADESDSKPVEFTSSDSDSSVETTTFMLAPVDNAPKIVYEPKVWTDALIIKEYESDSDDDSVYNVQENIEKPSFSFTDSVKHVKSPRENVKEKGTPNHYPKVEKQDRHSHTRKGLGYARKSCFVCDSFSHLIRDCDFHEKRMAKQAALPKSKEHGTGQQHIDQFFGVITQLFKSMLVQVAEEVGEAQDYKLENKVDQLEEENRALKEKYFKTTQVNTAAPVENIEKSFKHRRMIADMDEYIEEGQDKAYNLDLQHSEKVVTTAQPTTTAAHVPKAKVQFKDNDKGILIKEPKPLKGQVHIDMDEAFARKLEAELNANINWNDVIEQVNRSKKQDNVVTRYQDLKRKPMTKAQARKNMMIYLKNMAGFKMDFFKGMTYSEIRPIFEKHYNSIQAFLEKVEEEVTVQEEGNKRQEPKNFSDNFLLNIFKIIFEKPNVEANQMLDNVRLEVEEESEMSLELLRLVKRQLNEGYVPE
uniref:Xylulose kinase-1 n=1 Tax=Tanacetum cinerariifolium TaxID=118510 RepID=A0A6L2JQN7_TANCI|nr:xylulose kinase-1 [Tanacetum cinerariifolium]